MAQSRFLVPLNNSISYLLHIGPSILLPQCIEAPKHLPNLILPISQDLRRLISWTKRIKRMEINH